MTEHIFVFVLNVFILTLSAFNTFCATMVLINKHADDDDNDDSDVKIFYQTIYFNYLFYLIAVCLQM